MSREESWFPIEELKRTVKAEAVLSHFGIEGLRRSGAELIGPCPVHGGDNPTAFHVNVEKNVWYCHTGCGRGGSVVDLAMALLKTDVGGAAGYLREHLVGCAPRSVGEQEEGEAARSGVEPGPLGFELGLDWKHPYLGARGLRAETAEEFGVGYCSQGLFSGCVAIALRGADGSVVGYLGRELAGEGPKYRFPRGFGAGQHLYNLWRQESRAAVIVVEGPFDVMRLSQAGHGNCVGVLGSGVSPWQVGRLKEFNRVVLMFDGDAAGRAGSAECAAKLRASGDGSGALERPEVIEVTLPEGTDPASLSEGELQELLGACSGGGEAIDGEKESGADGETACGRASGEGVSPNAKRRCLTPEERWAILEESYSSREPVADVAGRHDVHRTTVYDIRESAKSILKDTWSATGLGRNSAGVPQSYGELVEMAKCLREEVKGLKDELAAKEKECALKEVRIEFLEFGQELYKKKARRESSTRPRRRKSSKRLTG